jgi:transcriptional regulator with GAF, ATPase, and Fis domain/predicted ATPase
MAMPTDLSQEEFEVLWDDGEFILSRVKNQHGRSPALLVRPATAYATAVSRARLKHAYALRDELEDSWTARPMELIDRSDELALFVQDPGGQLLATLIRKAWEVRPFVRVAIGLAHALGSLHRRGLVHRDLRPSNILVEVARGEAWLGGFTFTTRIQPEDHATSQPRLIAGTLAYIAPEQTGRMNRWVDTRSDLYSLGVILYEMLTGELPFKASDPMEWVHCHIARQPAAPSERVDGVPTTLSAIVLKLLAKNPEDRYQTARGLEADLVRCLTELESGGRIEEFLLGADDVPDRLLIPERLYGRGPEIASLVDAFENVARDGKQAFVLVSGYSGVGKSSIVNELRQTVVRRHGLFAAGKFEPHERDTPFAPIIRAIRNLVRSILVLSDAGVQKWGEDICRAVGANAQLIIDFVPEVQLIIGPQQPVADIPPQQAQVRFYGVLQRFVSVFARSEHPLVLFVDDLQWLDRASLDLVHNLAVHNEGMHLLLIGAYRQNEVGPAHPLTITLSAIRDAAVVREIDVVPLQGEDIYALISDTLHQSQSQIEPLANVVYEKTAGNPFFAKQFLQELAYEGCLFFDTSIGAWKWDLALIQAHRYTENIFDLLAAKLDRLSTNTQQALQHLACLSGGRADTLSIALGCSEDELNDKFAEANDAGFVWRSEEGYAFSHDRIREAAYALIPERERAAVHLKIGRSLLAKLPGLDTSEKIFEVVDQLNLGVPLVKPPAERVQIAELNLIAGRRARSSSAYKSALVYLAAGEGLLSEENWGQHYNLRFSLALHRAECEFLTGELVAADQRLSRLQDRAVGPTDLSAVTCLRIDVYTTMDRTDRAIEVGLDQLRVLGIELPVHPSEDEIHKEYDRLQQQLMEQTIEGLAALPSTSDPHLLATMEILMAMLPAATFADKNLLDFTLLRMSNLSFERGHSNQSALAYAQLSQVLGPRFHNRQDGFRFGNLGLALAEREEFTRSRAKVYNVVAYHVLPWTAPIPVAASLMRRAFELAQESGDLLFAAFSSSHLVSLDLAAGNRLEDVQLEAEQHLKASRTWGFGLLVACFLGQLHLVRSLIGQDGASSGSDEQSREEANIEARLEKDPRLAIAACWYWIRRLQARFHEASYTSALEMGAKAERLLWTSQTFFQFAEYHFYSALTHAKAWDSAPKAEAQRHHQAVSMHQAQLATWATDCAGTFGSRAALAAAELARLEDRNLDAERLYEEAILSASAAGAPNIEAIASELAAQFYLGRGFERIAQAYFASACSCYRRWGAEAVARRLDARCGAKFSALRPVHSTTSSAESLDLASVIKASHSISSEILIEKLVETLMTTAVQQAGAERGLLILRRGEDPRIEAEATTQLDFIRVRLLGTAAGPSDLPIAVLNYVLRTKEPVILDDATVSESFSADAYVAGHRVRSLLCLPLLKQTLLVGVLYLENKVASHVFTPSRIELLRLLASQAAISLENARLYGDLREAQAYLAEAQRLTRTGSFGWDVSTGELYWSGEMFRIFEFDPVAEFSIELILQRTHPEDRAAVQQVINLASTEGKDYDFEHRLEMPDGAVKHLHVVGHARRDELTGATQYVGAVTDVTAAKESRQALEKAYAEIQELKEQLQKENIVLREEIDRSSIFEEIVGESPALQTVLASVAKVAPVDSTVLVTGETGTGKELIARAIHKHSSRSVHAFVSVNCAAIPQSLIHSELFGHEKGAFTGAIQRRLGRFELAEGGTIFLDEVGELPAETQVALLRVLQEREFERLGSARTIAANVRVIAATNRDLVASIEAGAFRRDLYYRLNVFPIEVPPLRKRKEDIPLLVGYFVDRYSRKSGKSIRSINRKTLDRLKSYDWPGNIRELQNVVERSVILCETETLAVDESWLSQPRIDETEQPIQPFLRMSASQEKRTIEVALSDSRGQVSGPSGAAAKLGIPPSTLDSKIKALSIDKRKFKRI